MNGGVDLHVERSYGHNVHHIVEGIFKGLGRALDEATHARPAHPGRALDQGLAVTHARSRSRSSTTAWATCATWRGRWSGSARARASRTRRPSVRAAARLVLPGVGSVRDTMAALRGGGLDDALREHIAAGRPYLGHLPRPAGPARRGGGRRARPVPGRDPRPRRALPATPTSLAVPHMGWNLVKTVAAAPGDRRGLLLLRARLPRDAACRCRRPGCADGLRRDVPVRDRPRRVRGGAVPPREEPARRPRAARALLRLATMTRVALAPRRPRSLSAARLRSGRRCTAAREGPVVRKVAMLRSRATRAGRHAPVRRGRRSWRRACSKR